MNDKPSIVAVLARYNIEVEERTGWRPVRCGFHDDHTASAAVNTDLDSYSCLACGVKGDSWSILQQQEGITFREAVELGKQLDPSAGNETSHNRVRVTGKKRAYRPPGRRGRR